MKLLNLANNSMGMMTDIYLNVSNILVRITDIQGLWILHRIICNYLICNFYSILNMDMELELDNLHSMHLEMYKSH